MRRRLVVLGPWFWEGRENYRFDAALRYRLRPEEQLDLALWRRAYLGRYLRFQPSEVDRMTLRTARRYVELVGELIAKETAAIVPSEDV